jgi:hypothetical protein
LRILDDASDKKLDSVTIFLTKEEVAQLRGYLNQLLDNPKLQHSHLSISDYKKEIIVCVYKEDNLSSFDERSRNLIINDK